jgi:hypothetical protein
MRLSLPLRVNSEKNTYASATPLSGLQATAALEHIHERAAQVVVPEHLRQPPKSKRRNGRLVERC